MREDEVGSGRPLGLKIVKSIFKRKDRPSYRKLLFTSLQTSISLWYISTKLITFLSVYESLAHSLVNLAKTKKV